MFTANGIGDGEAFDVIGGTAVMVTLDGVGVVLATVARELNENVVPNGGFGNWDAGVDTTALFGTVLIDGNDTAVGLLTGAG